jgi:hypothetical protein
MIDMEIRTSLNGFGDSGLTARVENVLCVLWRC